jgi:hypothetical protein
LENKKELAQEVLFVARLNAEKHPAESKPEWVPDRVWEGWLDVLGDGGDFSNSALAIFDKNCTCVWSSLDKRMTEISSIAEFFYEIETACLVSRRFKLSQKERKRNASKMEKAARNLRETIAAGAVQKFDKKSNSPVSFMTIVEAEMMSAVEIAMLKGFKADISEHAALSAAGNVVSNFHDVLMAIEKSAQLLAQGASGIEASLGSKNPARLEFIRSMTRSFYRAFGTPLREQVAALASCIYCCNIDAATVAKLAPVVKDEV